MGCQQGKSSAPAPKGRGEAAKSPLLLGNELPVAGTKEELQAERETTFDDLREQVWRSSTQPSMKKFEDALNAEDDADAMETFAGATEPEPDSETTPRHNEDAVDPPVAAAPAAAPASQPSPAAVAAAAAPAGPAAAPAEKVATGPPPGEAGRSYFSNEVRRDYGAGGLTSASGHAAGGVGRPAGVVTSQEVARQVAHRINALEKPPARDTPAPPADVLITAKDVSRAGEAAAARKLGQPAARKEKNSCCC